MQFKPHEYQRRAIEWVMDHPRCLLFLEMGLGKTAICLTAIQRLLQYGEVSNVLVIAPRKVAESTWSDEAARWDHLGLTVSNVVGDPKHRIAALQASADVYCIGRDSLVWLTEHLGDSWDFDMVVIDELTGFKSHTSLRFKALKRMQPRISRIVGLTGTPTPNGLMDLWGQVYCIDMGHRLGKYITHYRDKWFTFVLRNNIAMYLRPKPEAMSEIMAAIEDIALAMRSEDWLSLPSLTETDMPVVLPESVMKGYRSLERERLLRLTEDGKPLTADSAAACVNKLAQYANGAVYDEDSNVIKIHDEKIAALEEIYESEPQSPLLVFYQFKHDRIRIESYFRNKYSDMFCRVYQGARDLWDWNKGIINMMLCHPASTAFGLNMQQGGCRIAWFSTGWNLEHYQQANARLHRQGQQRPVKVFRIIAKGTVDERMAAAITTKADTQRDVVKSLVGDMVSEYNQKIDSK